MTEHEPPTALERLIREGSSEDLRRFLLLLQPPEIADIIEALESREDRTRAFRAIVGTKRSHVFRDIEEDEREELLEELSPRETARIVSGMRSDDAADVILDLDEDQQAAVLRHIEPSSRARIDEVIRYEEESAGGIMQTELVRVREAWTIRQAVEEIRRTREEVGELHEIFVVDADDRLKGWVKERALILAADDDRIRSVTTPIPIRVPVGMDQEEIAVLVQDYDLSSVPVVDDEDRLVGRILVDDIVDVVTEEATEDITRLGGTTPEEIYTPSIARALRSRTPWLIVAFGGLAAASLIIKAGEDVVRQAGSLFAFIPVIMGMGGGSSTQAATVTVRSLALGRIEGREALSVLGREIGTAFVVAVGTALALWALAYVLSADVVVAWIASLAVFGTICLGTTFGVITPLVLDRLGVDPAVATSPFVTTMNDLMGSTIIMVVAVLVL